MSTSLVALLGFTGWTLALVLTVFAYRLALVLSMKKPANSWPRGAVADDPGLVTRISHAHLNCLESLPVFAAIVLSASVLGKLSVTDPVAMFVLYARIAQSATHMVGVTHWLVFTRASFWSIQALLCAYMIWGLLH